MSILYKIKQNHGFTLIELMVTMGLVAMLILVAIPSYNRFKNKAKEVSLKSDVSTGYKSYHSFNSVEDTFCASFQAVGLENLINSELYEGARVKNSMVGFTAMAGVDAFSKCDANDITFDEAIATTVLQKKRHL